MTLEEFARYGQDRIQNARLECADPLLHMKQILQYACDFNASDIAMRWRDPFPKDGSLERARHLLARRLEGEPFQYIVREEWFWKDCFLVGPGVLIPRRETEILLETLLSDLDASKRCRIVEMGAGSGNIGVSALKERANWGWHGFEINESSIPYLKTNIERLLPDDIRYHIHHADIFESLEGLGEFDAVVANPPYVTTHELRSVSVEVSHEPVVALHGGGDGLEPLRRLIEMASLCLNPGGYFISEMGAEQADGAKRQLSQCGFKDIEVVNDLAGLPRVIKGFK